MHLRVGKIFAVLLQLYLLLLFIYIYIYYLLLRIENFNHECLTLSVFEIHILWFCFYIVVHNGTFSFLQDKKLKSGKWWSGLTS